MTNERASTEDLERRTLLLSDLLKVIEHMHDMEGANGLSAVIDAAQEHVDFISRALDIVSREVAPNAVNTPVMKLFRSWMALREMIFAAMDALPKDADEEPLYAPLDILEKQIVRTESLTAADFAAKMIICTSEGTLNFDWKSDPVWAEARKLVGMNDAA